MTAQGSEPIRYFVCHMQKTAGTTLRNRLAPSFREDEIYPNKIDRGDPLEAVISVQELERRWEARNGAYRLLTGHFPRRTVERFGVPFTTMTVLRHPVERTLSFLRHQAARGQRGATADTPLVEIYEDPFRFEKMIQNHMVRMLSLTPDEMVEGDGVLSTVPYTSERLDMAKEGLAALDLFGLQEHFEDFCAEIAAHFGLTVGPPVRENTTEDQDVPAGLIDRIAEDNALDVALYEHAVSLHQAAHA